MKKNICIIMSIAILLCGCNSTMNEDESQKNNTEIVSVTDKKTDRYNYDINAVKSFTVDKTDIWILRDDKNTVEKYDENANKVDEINIGEGEYTLVNILDGTLYVYGVRDTSIILEINTDDKTIVEHEIVGNFSDPFYMTVLEDEIYAICWNLDQETLDNEMTDDGYINMGEYAVKIDRNTYNVENVGIDCVIGQCRYSDSQILYYAHDDGGYYFIIYNSSSDTWENKKYNNALGYQFSLSIDTKDGYIFAANYNESRLVMGNIENEKKKDFIDDIIVKGGNDLVYSDSKCYILDGTTKDIIRVDCTNIKESANITVYANIVDETPYSCGYNMNIKTPEDDEFKLSVLACDKKYDIAFLTGASEYAYGIKQQGAYYDLQDVPNVKEYLDSCFPYVHTAATTDGGEIWMIPVSVSIPLIMYNDENCKEAGIEDNFYDSYEGIISAADVAYKNENLREKYSVNAYRLQQYMVEQYLATHIENNEADFNTAEFKEICELMKKNSPDDKESLHTFITDTTVDGFLFEMLDYNELNGYSNDNVKNNKIVGMPYITDKQGNEVQKNFGTCLFMCVNPNSDNLDEALEYISDYCAYMMQNNKNLLLKNNNSNFKEIYENGEIVFEIPLDIFWNSYLDYIRGKQGYEKMVTDVNSKVNMYLNE